MAESVDRIATVDEVARVVEMFAGPMGAFVSGQVLRVDGGMVASDWTMQALADILDAPVDRLAVRTYISPFDPVIIREALRREGLPREMDKAPIGGAAYDAASHPLPADRKSVV